MRRRQCIALLAGAAIALPLAALAQQGGKIPTIGILWHAGSAEEEEPYFKAMLEGFAGAGYVVGRTIKLEHRFPNEMPERFRSMAAELVSLQVDVLVGVGVAASSAVKNATTAIPVVFTLAPDPVAGKLVESLARPGGNATGLSTMAGDLVGKWLQFLKDTIPGLARVALLVNPHEPASRRYIAEGEVAAAQLGLTQHTFEVGALDALAPAFDAMVRAGMQAVIVGPGGLFYQARATIPQLALERRLPTCVWSRETLAPGALLSYGADLLAIVRRTAAYVDKILKGTKAADLPVEQPTKFELIINLRTAQALGLTMPPALLFQADKVIK